MPGMDNVPHAYFELSASWTDAICHLFHRKISENEWDAWSASVLDYLHSEQIEILYN